MPNYLTRLALCSLIAVGTGGCVFLEDFSEFKEDPAFFADGGDKDAASDMGDAEVAPEQDAEVDAGDAPVDPCEGVDCSDVDSECGVGQCVKGKCVAQPIAAMDGEACKADKCTEDPVCEDGLCKGSPKDCSAFDSDCTRGVCEPSDGSCSFDEINEDDPCFDDDPCVVGESCKAGKCKGSPKDCSALTDACNVGTCNDETGACYDDPANLGDDCDDEDACTETDKCNATGGCEGTTFAADTTVCDDGDPCTIKEHCDGSGDCTSDGFADNGTVCEDGNECTEGETCDGAGWCSGGVAAREGEACWVGCESGDICSSGTCIYTEDSVIDSSCQFIWCNNYPANCKDSYNGDGYCDCGCGFEDVDCSPCSKHMCLSYPKFSHDGAVWCDSTTNEPVDNCPASLKNNGVCDCGCQFDDPDCNGGKCCSATGEPGCDDAFIEECVCSMIDFGNSDCCTVEWTADCAALAVNYGCALCP